MYVRRHKFSLGDSYASVQACFGVLLPPSGQKSTSAALNSKIKVELRKLLLMVFYEVKNERIKIDKIPFSLGASEWDVACF